MEAQLEDEKVWKNRKKLASIQKEHKSLKSSYSEMQKINNDVEMAQYTLNSLLKDNLIEKNIDLVREMKDLIANADKLLYAIEFKQMF